MQLRECFVGSLVRPGAQQAEFVPVAIPIRNLLDGRLLNVIRQGSLARADSVARQYVAARIRDAALLVEGAQRSGQREHTRMANQILDASLFNPAAGFV